MNRREEIEEAIDDYGISSEIIGSERCRHAPLSTAKAMITRDRAALIALIFDTPEPVVITDAEIEAGAKALWWHRQGDDPSINLPTKEIWPIVCADARFVLEAAARSRATTGKD
jgi:hypothetical protein